MEEQKGAKSENISWYGIPMPKERKKLIKEITYTNGKFSKRKAIKALNAFIQDDWRSKVAVVYGEADVDYYLLSQLSSKDSKAIKDSTQGEIAYKIAEKLLKEGFLNIEERHDPVAKRVIFEETLYCLKHKPKKLYEAN